MHVNSFRDLQVYKLARQLALEIFELTKGFPAEELYSFNSQVRRSSRSVGAQIAEAWAKRRYEKHFMISKARQFCGRSTDHRSPTTDHRQPITDHRSPTTDNRSPITDNHPPCL